MNLPISSNNNLNQNVGTNSSTSNTVYSSNMSIVDSSVAPDPTAIEQSLTYLRNQASNQDIQSGGTGGQLTPNDDASSLVQQLENAAPEDQVNTFLGLMSNSTPAGQQPITINQKLSLLNALSSMASGSSSSALSSSTLAPLFSSLTNGITNTNNNFATIHSDSLAPAQVSGVTHSNVLPTSPVLSPPISSLSAGSNSSAGWLDCGQVVTMQTSMQQQVKMNMQAQNFERIWTQTMNTQMAALTTEQADAQYNASMQDAYATAAQGVSSIVGGAISIGGAVSSAKASSKSDEALTKEAEEATNPTPQQARLKDLNTRSAQLSDDIKNNDAQSAGGAPAGAPKFTEEQIQQKKEQLDKLNDKKQETMQDMRMAKSRSISSAAEGASQIVAGAGSIVASTFKMNEAQDQADSIIFQQGRETMSKSWDSSRQTEDSAKKNVKDAVDAYNSFTNQITSIFKG